MSRRKPRRPRNSREQSARPVSLTAFGAWGACVFALALAIRLVHVVQLRRSPFFSTLMGDARAYDQWAQRLASDGWVGSDVFYQAPLYPYFLGVVYAIGGHDLLLVRIVQAGLGALACLFVALAAARLFSPRAGAIAGLMMALYAPAIFVGGLIQKSVLDLVLIALLLLIVAILVEHPRRLPWWIGLGATLGALCLTRENALVLVAIVLGWAVVADRAAARSDRGRLPVSATLSVVLGLAVMLTPVVARNRAVGGGFYLTTAQFGPNFYIGNNPQANGTYRALREGRGDPLFEREDATALAEAALGRHLTPGEVSTFWRDRALEFITGEPLRWLALLGRKALLLVNATEMLDTEAQESHAEWSAALRVTGWVSHFGVLLPLAVLGAIVTWPDRRRISVLYALTLGYAASVLAFFVFARYRYPLVPVLTLFASASLVSLPTFLRERPVSHLLYAAGLVGVSAVVAQWPVWSSHEMRAITETNLGVALHGQRQYDQAIEHYRRAVAIANDYAPGYNNLGVALRAQGRLDEAVAAYHQALNHAPNYIEVHYNLAIALFEQKQFEAAIRHFRMARQSMPATVGAHHNFGLALLAVGLRQEAIAELRNALGIDPNSTMTLGTLGNALVQDGRHSEAIVEFRRIVELEPDNPAAHYDLGSVLMEARKFPEAADEFRGVLRLAPDSAQAHNNLGVALAAQGRIEEAIPQFERALALKPDFTAAQRYLAAARREVREKRNSPRSP